MPKSSKPHIIVDAFPLVDSHFSGVGHSTLGIVRAFDELAGEGKITYSLVSPKQWANRLDKYNFRNYKKIIKNPISHRAINGIMKLKIRLPLDLLLGRGYYFFPSFLAWPTWFSKSAVLIHDATYLAVPDCVIKSNRDFLERVVPFSIRNAHKIVTVSEFSKKELLKYYQELKPDDIVVAYNCVDRRLFYRRSKEEIHSVKAKYDIYSEKYILSVGNIEPRKNYEKLIDAYISLPKRITKEYPLVIIGAGGWNNDGILDKIQKAKEQGYKIINPKQFVVDKDMPALFSGASIYVFTPIYEGFGMSPLEAYACGTPVIVSDIPPLHESAGSPAEYVNYNSKDDIKDKIQILLEKVKKDPDYKADDEDKYLSKFSWRKSGEKIVAGMTGLPIDNFMKDKK